MSTLTLTSNNFKEEVLSCDIPVLIDFWAPWCGPCRMLGPTIDEIAGEYQGRIKVAKVNVDEEPELASEFQVMSIPTLAVIKNGKITATSVGLRSKESVLELVER